VDASQWRRQQPSPGSLEPPRQLSLRRLVLGTFSAAMSAFVWHRTGGDHLLTSTSFIVVFGALDHWVRDDMAGSL
jgi:hypothetical protein